MANTPSKLRNNAYSGNFATRIILIDEPVQEEKKSKPSKKKRK